MQRGQNHIQCGLEMQASGGFAVIDNLCIVTLRPHAPHAYFYPSFC